MSVNPPEDGKTPDDILNSYLDDLLGTEDLLGVALDAFVQHTDGQGMTEESTVLARSSVTALSGSAAGSTGLMSAPPSRATSSTVVQLPLKQPNLHLAQRPASTTDVVTPETKSQAEQGTSVKADYAEPLASSEQRKKLERLLQSARAPVIADVVPVITETKTTFVDNPGEIQDWAIESIAEPEIADALIEQTPVTPASFQLPGLEWQANGRPEWAQGRFDVLLFQVAGLTLAVPLIALGQIQPITDELTPLFGQADWFMGLQPTPAGKIRTVNTARFVMPERYDEAFVKTAKYVVSIDGVPWGLAVDSVNQPITLQPDDVKWRGDRSKRPWLAGTVKDHMCALLDIPRIGQMLIEADKNFSSPAGGRGRQ